jgi:uncharacterized membrane protein YedE/YeeE
MAFWPWWAGGLFLAALPLVHWFLLHRMFAVSGRFSSITDWMRGKREAAPVVVDDALLLALQRETAEAFGEDAVAALAQSSPLPMATPATTTPHGLLPHLLFLLGVTLGGTVSVWLATGSAPRPHLPAGELLRLFGDNPFIDFAVLGFGGMLVGFGTRMAGGCTSGHGLCGVSRLQPGSLVATACFFGFAIAVSFALTLLRGWG